MAAKLPVISTVCCALGIADFNATVRRFHIDRAKRYLDLAYDLRGRNLLLVVGEYVWNQEVIAPADQWRFAIEGVREVGRHATDLGLEVAVELEPFDLSIVNTIDKMDRFLSDVKIPAVKANVDVSHLVLANDPASAILKLRGRIAHVHLSDCDGKKHGDLPPGRGVVDFPPYLQAWQRPGLKVLSASSWSIRPNPIRLSVGWRRHIQPPTLSCSNRVCVLNERRMAYGTGCSG